MTASRLKHTSRTGIFAVSSSRSISEDVYSSDTREICASISFVRLRLSHCLENISLILIVLQKANAFKSPDLDEKSHENKQMF